MNVTRPPIADQISSDNTEVRAAWSVVSLLAARHVGSDPLARTTINSYHCIWSCLVSAPRSDQFDWHGTPACRLTSGASTTADASAGSVSHRSEVAPTRASSQPSCPDCCQPRRRGFETTLPTPPATTPATRHHHRTSIRSRLDETAHHIHRCGADRMRRGLAPAVSAHLPRPAHRAGLGSPALRRNTGTAGAGFVTLQRPAGRPGRRRPPGRAGCDRRAGAGRRAGRAAPAHRPEPPRPACPPAAPHASPGTGTPWPPAGAAGRRPAAAPTGVRRGRRCRSARGPVRRAGAAAAPAGQASRAPAPIDAGPPPGRATPGVAPVGGPVLRPAQPARSTRWPCCLPASGSRR